MVCPGFMSGAVGGFPLMAVLGLGFTALFWLGLAALVIWVVRTLVDGRQAGSEQPMDVPKRRFAAGEIGQAEFEEARRTLLERGAS